MLCSGELPIITMPYIMKKLALVVMLAVGLFEILNAQEVKIPDKISISDKFFSPWGTNLLYKYEFDLNEDRYNVQRVLLLENGKKSHKKTQVGKVDIQLIKQILVELNGDPTKEINAADFVEKVPLDSINNFFKNQADNHRINKDYQQQYIIEQLTETDKLKQNLELYFKDYDHSEWFDGPSTEINIILHFGDSILSINSKSILRCGLPLEINGIMNYSPKLSALIGDLIPDSRTYRKEQFSGENLFSVIIDETIDNHRKIIDNLELRIYKVNIDSLGKTFIISNLRIIEYLSSTNWDGEKRLSCRLRDTSMINGISIDYSTRIDSDTLLFPVSLIISNYKRLYEKVMNVAFFRDYIMENSERKLSIIYDDNSCFTEKSKKYLLNDCSLSILDIDLKNAIFISIRNEFGDFSRWGLLPNFQYFMWWDDGNPPIPIDDKNYLKCD
jgi:hypothetical protein